MKVKVFTLPWRSEAGGFDDTEVFNFLETRTAIDVSEHFFVHEKTPVLVLVVTYRGDGARAEATGSRRPHGASAPDPAAELDPDEHRRYEALRTWRNQYARKAGRPPYTVFTNRQAAGIARRAPATRAALGEVQGLGASRLDDFGDEILSLLGELARAPSQASESSDVSAAAAEAADGDGTGA